MSAEQWLFERMTWLVPLWLCLGVHEWAHAWTAWRLGDDTARLQGRLSLNPFAHVDPVGTLLLPVLGVPFGWAKPVPVEPLRFHRRVRTRWGMLLVAAAGPVSNVLLGVLCAGGLAALTAFPALPPAVAQPLWMLLYTMVLLNGILAVFNLLPIPPLDGSRIVDSVLPNRLRPGWNTLCRYGPLVLLAVILLPVLAGASPFAGVMRALGSWMARLQTWLA